MSMEFRRCLCLSIGKRLGERKRSLWQIFFNSKDNCNNKLSNTSYSFMAGVMNHGDTISKINNFFHNPYLVFAACLRYGLNGIKNKLK